MASETEIQTELKPVKQDFHSGESWDDIIENVWPNRRKILYSLTEPRALYSGWHYPWNEGQYNVFLPLSAKDLHNEKAPEFKKMLIEDIRKVKEHLKSYTNWNIVKDSVKRIPGNIGRAILHPSTIYVAAYTPPADKPFSIILGLFSLVLEHELLIAPRKNRDDLIESLGKFEEEGSLKIKYYPEIDHYETEL